MGCRLEICHFSERLMLKELEAGHFDIALGASKTEKRLETFLYSKPYRVATNKSIKIQPSPYSSSS